MYEITDILYPNWRMQEFFLRNIMLPYALTTDASDNTRSMSSPQTTRDEINDGFDDIAYDKGKIYRML
jgi:aminopeptidase N